MKGERREDVCLSVCVCVSGGIVDITAVSFITTFTSVLRRHAQQAGTVLAPWPLMKYYYSGGRIRAFFSGGLSQSSHSFGRLRGEQDLLPNKV